MAIHLPIGSLTTRSGLEPVPRCELSHGGKIAPVRAGRCTDGRRISRRDPATSRHSTHERQRWNVSVHYPMTQPLRHRDR